MDLRSVQKPLKEKYRSEPGSSRITLRARGSQTDTPISCSVDIGRAVYEAQAHAGVGGSGTAACAQVTCQMVAEAMGIETERIEVEVEGDLDLAGTLGVSRDVPVGFERIRTRFDVRSEEHTSELQSRQYLVCRLLLEKKNPYTPTNI